MPVHSGRGRRRSFAQAGVEDGVPMILTFLMAQRHIIRAFTFASPK
jgi:ABC-type maltose transport system permease subunit